MPFEGMPSIPPVGAGRDPGCRGGARAVRGLPPDAGPRSRPAARDARQRWMVLLAPFAPRPVARSDQS